MTTLELLKEAQDLPVEERAFLADSLLRSLSSDDTEVKAQWVAKVRRRAKALDEGTTSSITLEEWRQKVQARFHR
jgi:putative addiction module component (TIGR02574 family)